MLSWVTFQVTARASGTKSEVASRAATHVAARIGVIWRQGIATRVRRARRVW